MEKAEKALGRAVWGFFALFTFLHHEPEGNAQVKKVTTYIVDVQEERQSTRWTLTEWLRIKERMKMMDVWLALFSNPKKEKFAPELMLDFGGITGKQSVQPLEDETLLIEQEKAALSRGKLQFWFTNLVSSSTGLKTLNIDLGLEGGTVRSGTSPKQDGLSPTETLQNPPWDTLEWQAPEMNWGLVNFRIFGRNIQDSSLILKGGFYEGKPWFDRMGALEKSKLKGVAAGAEAYFYLLSWLGIEGDYLRFGNQSGASGTEALNASFVNYGGFIEIYNVRIGYRVESLQQSWQLEPDIYQSELEGSSWYVRLNF